MNEQLKQQIEKKAKSSAANFGYYPGSEECEDLESAYITGATAYATRAITAEAENERLRKALEGIRDYFIKCNNNNEVPDLLTVVLSIDEAITTKPTTNE